MPKGDEVMEIFAIGHSNYPYVKFIEMIKKYNINCIVDIRETPYSKYNVQYNKEYFREILKKDVFLKRVKRIKNGIDMGYRIVLLGAMQEPIRCHRSIMVGRFLKNEGIDVKYILHEETLATQDYIEEALLNKYFEDRNQISIDSLIGKGQSKQDMIEKAYKLANKEIGYRTENIK